MPFFFKYEVFDTLIQSDSHEELQPGIILRIHVQANNK